MRNDVHFAALRAAAKVAFSVASVALVNGCSSSEGPASDGDKTGESASSDLVSKDKAPAKEGTDAGPTKPSCDALLASTFPNDPDDFVFEPFPASAQVVACCDTELTTHGSASAYRWECCFAYDPATVPPGEDPPGGFGHHGAACTPWGPPVPPSMDRFRAGRRARFTRPVSDVSILRAVA